MTGITEGKQHNPCFCLNPSVEIIEAINPLTTSVFHYVETSQLICSANQLTGFQMLGNTGR